MKTLMTSGMLLLSLSAFAQVDDLEQAVTGRVEIRESGGRYAPTARVSRPERALFIKKVHPGRAQFQEGESAVDCFISNATVSVEQHSETFRDGIRRESYVTTSRDLVVAKKTYNTIYGGIEAVTKGTLVVKPIVWDDSLPVTTYFAFQGGKETEIFKLVNGEEASANDAEETATLVKLIDRACGLQEAL